MSIISKIWCFICTRGYPC